MIDREQLEIEYVRGGNMARLLTIRGLIMGITPGYDGISSSSRQRLMDAFDEVMDEWRMGTYADD